MCFFKLLLWGNINYPRDSENYAKTVYMETYMLSFCEIIPIDYRFFNHIKQCNF